MVVGRRLSYLEGNFSGAMLNFRRVYYMAPKPMMGLKISSSAHHFGRSHVFLPFSSQPQKPRIPLKVMMGSWWTWELLFQARCCKVSSGEEEETSRVSWFRNGWNVKKIGSNRIWRAIKTKPSLDSWTTWKYISVMTSPILTNPVRKFVDPAVFYWTSPLLYIGKKYVLSHRSHHHPTRPKKDQRPGHPLGSYPWRCGRSEQWIFHSTLSSATRNHSWHQIHLQTYKESGSRDVFMRFWKDPIKTYKNS